MKDREELVRESEESMRVMLRGKTWVEKVRSIERMKVADKVAKAAMRKALAKEAEEAS